MSAPLKQYLIYAPYFSDALPRRETARPMHQAQVAERANGGIMTMGGSLLDEQGNLTGNCLIIHASSLEECKKLLQSDAYYIHRVWDPSMMLITEWRPANLH